MNNAPEGMETRLERIDEALRAMSERQTILERRLDAVCTNLRMEGVGINLTFSERYGYATRSPGNA